MPEIPQVSAPNLTPPPEMNPNIAGGVGAAMAGAADQLASAADMGFQVTDRIKKSQDEGIVLDAENQIESDIQNANAQLANWSDYTNAGQLKQDTATAMREKYEEKYGNRPDLWKHIEPRLGKELNFYNAQVDVHAAKLTQDFNQSALTETLGKTVEKASLIPTLAGQELELSQFDMKANAMALNRSISFTQAFELKKQARSQTIEAQVRRAENPLNAPEVMQREMERLKEYEGKDWVPAEKLAEYQDHLGEAYKVASRNFDEKAVLKKSFDVIASGEKDSTNIDVETGLPDYLKIAEKSDADETLSPQQRKAIREEAEQRDGLQKRQVAERDTNQINKIQPQLYDLKHPITEADIKRRALIANHNDPQWISKTTESHALTATRQLTQESRATNIQTRMALSAEAKEDSAEAFSKVISQPGYLSKDDISALIKDNPKLSYTDALHAVEIKSSSQDPYFQGAQKVLQEAANNGTMTIADYGEANVALLKEAKEKNLSGGQLIEKAREIVKPGIEKQIKNNLDWILYPEQKRAAEEAEKSHTTNWLGRSTPMQPSAPAVGTINNGYKFLGGDPSKPENWHKQ